MSKLLFVPRERGIQQIVDDIATVAAADFSSILPESISMIALKPIKLQLAFTRSSSLDWKAASRKRIWAYCSSTSEESALQFSISVFLLCLLSLVLRLNNFMSHSGILVDSYEAQFPPKKMCFIELLLLFPPMIRN